MDCPHLNSCTKITSESAALNQENLLSSWNCLTCSSSESSWLCLYCAKIHCGRYVNGHAKLHFEQHSDHCLCLEFNSLSVYCYKCDDFVAEDAKDKAVQNIRDRVVFLQSSTHLDESEGSNSIHNSDNVNSRLQQDVLEPTDRKRRKSSRIGSARKESRKRLISEDIGIENKDSKKSRAERKAAQSKTQELRKVAGLRNLGNTCFMNAVLQSLSKITEFSWYFKQLPSLETKPPGVRTYSTRQANEKALIAEELRKVLISLNQNEGKGAISPESLFRVIWEVVPRFRGYQQQDAHEFLRYMLDRLHTELMLLLPNLPSVMVSGTLSTEISKGKSSIVTAVFGGTLQSEVCCLRCRTQSIKHDPFLDLSLDIPDSRVIKKESVGKESCSLADCLTSFVEVEELAETELYYCESCRSKQKSTKKFWIGRLPNVLCLHIKRFRWEHYLRTKLDANVEFPLTALDMSRFVLNKSRDTQNTNEDQEMNLFDLAAVIVHHGSGAGSGHYTAFATHEGQWFHFDDSTVKPTTEDVVAKCNAYILFYIRREFRMPQVP